MKKYDWTLIDNDAHRILSFASERKLRLHARRGKQAIKKSPSDPRAFYMISAGCVPANGSIACMEVSDEKV